MKGVRVWVRNQIPAYPRVKVNVEKKRRKKKPAAELSAGALAVLGLLMAM